MFGDYLPPDPNAASPLNSAYYQKKINDFQQVLYDMDNAAKAATVIVTDYGDIDPVVTESMIASLDEFDAKKTEFRTVAEALNGAVAMANAVGGSFYPVKVPESLGVVPLLGIAAVIATAAVLCTWGQGWINHLDATAKLDQVKAYADSITDPVAHDALVTQLSTISASQTSIDNSLGGNIATMVKWVAIAAVAYFGFQAFQKVK